MKSPRKSQISNLKSQIGVHQQSRFCKMAPSGYWRKIAQKRIHGFEEILTLLFLHLKEKMRVFMRADSHAVDVA